MLEYLDIHDLAELPAVEQPVVEALVHAVSQAVLVGGGAGARAGAGAGEGAVS